MSKISDDEIIAKLKENNLKITPQRIAICRTVLSSDNHPSVEQIYDSIKKEYPTISISTIYKSLILLQKIGLVNELRFNENHTRYEPKTSLHINIVCPECMSIYDFESETLNENWKKIISDIEGEINGQRIDVYKTCENCKE